MVIRTTRNANSRTERLRNNRLFKKRSRKQTQRKLREFSREILSPSTIKKELDLKLKREREYSSITQVNSAQMEKSSTNAILENHSHSVWEPMKLSKAGI